MIKKLRTEARNYATNCLNGYTFVDPGFLNVINHLPQTSVQESTSLAPHYTLNPTDYDQCRKVTLTNTVNLYWTERQFSCASRI